MSTTVKYSQSHGLANGAASSAAATRGQPCPLFWPEREQHGVRYVPLQAELTGEVAALAPKLRSLAAIGDAFRSLQTRDGAVLSPDAADTLAERTADILLELAAAPVVDVDTAEILRLRARAFVEGGSHDEAAIREAELTASTPLTVLCGPMCTWRLKTRTPLHTVVAAAGCPSYDEYVATLDNTLEAAATSLREDLGLRELQFDVTYPMRVTDMIACGGEANAYPKHFAYFLPEDENVPSVPGQRKKTVVFRNAYRDRHTVLSQPLGESLLRGPRLGSGVPAERPLLLWFRGHDIGHTAALPSTDYSWHYDLGHEPFMMIQEALADVYGFLLAVTPAWLSIGGPSAADVGNVFLSELLHYMRRGPWLHGDAGAAYLELSYLAANGFVEIGPDGTIRWEIERLQEGMRDLAGALATAVLAPQTAQPCARLVAEYGWPTRTGATKALAALHSGLRGVPTALAYCAPAILDEQDGPPPAPARAPVGVA